MQVGSCVHGKSKQVRRDWKWKLNVFFWITISVVMYEQIQKDTNFSLSLWHRKHCTRSGCFQFLSEKLQISRTVHFRKLKAPRRVINHVSTSYLIYICIKRGRKRQELLHSDVNSSLLGRDNASERVREMVAQPLSAWWYEASWSFWAAAFHIHVLRTELPYCHSVGSPGGKWLDTPCPTRHREF